MLCIDEYISEDDLANKIQDENRWKEILLDKKLICKNYNHDNELYIIKYNKKLLGKEEYLTTGKLRSLVYYKKNIVSFSPPKSIGFQEFIKTYPISECYAEDFIEGTMINVFYVKELNEWKISTKSSIDASVFFYDKNYTFNTMFFDACKMYNFDINNLIKDYCYTFVLQHPDNRIVLPIIHPSLYLIKVYKINKNIIETVNLPEFYFNNNNMFTNENGVNIGIPNIYPITSYEELSNYFASMNTPYYYPGIMIYHNSGERTKLRNPVYEDVKFLRGNQPKLLFHYLNLRKEGKVKNYLIYYPEHKKILNEFRNIIHRYTTTLWENYIYCFINKNKHLKEYPFQLKIHMYNLHKLYIDNKVPITKTETIKYINSLDPAQIMYALNYDSITT